MDKHPKLAKDKQDRLPVYGRVKHPPLMRLTKRERGILKTLYDYDGILSVDQVNRWFFPGENNKRNAQRRMSKLYHNRYIQRPSRAELLRLPEPIIWLDELGAAELAKQLEIPLDELPWRSTPAWSRVAHDILLNEFRHSVETAVSAHSTYSLETWHGQDELTRLFSYPIPYRDREGQRYEKMVYPDGYFCLQVASQGHKPSRLRCFVELDNGTEPNGRFARDKVSPGIHLIYSSLYQQQMGAKSGRFLVVVAGSQARFDNMRAEVTLYGGAPYFLFTRLVWVTPESVLRQPIWQFAHKDGSFSLSAYATPEFQAQLPMIYQDVPHFPLLKS